MNRRTVLATGALATALVAIAPAAAMAGDIRVDTSSTGVKRLLFSESRDAATGAAISQKNSVTIRLSGGNYVVRDATTPITPGVSCQQGANANEAICAADGVQRIVVTLGLDNDSFDNQTSTPAQVSGNAGSDHIINSGGGDDVITSAGDVLDQIDSCGAGNDVVNSDGLDLIAADAACEVINGVGPGGPTPNPGAPGAPTPPTNRDPISPAPVGTPIPVAGLGVPLQGACKVLFQGTEAADRIDGSTDGDAEFGRGGDDFMKGQQGDDCLYGENGKDTLIGDDGVDQLVGGIGNDAEFGGNGNDKIYANAGNDSAHGNGGNDRLSGAAGNDRLFGDDGIDEVLGAAGKDRLSGGAGRDRLSGGEADDQLFAGAGNDTLIGGKGVDVLSAGTGNDTISARDGRIDTIRCGSGSDKVTADRRDKVAKDCEKVTRR